MAINWGAALGTAVNTGINTYERLGEEETRQMQREKMQRELEKEKQEDEIAQNTFGRVGKESFDNINSVLAAKGMAIDPEAPQQEAIAAPSTYTRAQAESDYVDQFKAIRPKEGFQLESMALTTKAARREAKISEGFDSMMQKVAGTFENAVESKNPDALVDLAKDRGFNLKYTNNKDGSSTFQLYDKAGKSLGAANGFDEAAAKLREPLFSNLLETEGMKYFGSMDKLSAHILKKQEVAIKQQEANDKGMYYRASASAMGRPKETMKSKVEEYADTLMDSGAINPKTDKPYASREEAKAYAAGVVLRDPYSKPDRVNPYKEKVDDYASILFETGETNPATKKPFANMEEARKYAAGVVLRDPAQAQSLKQLTKPQEMAYNKVLDILTGSETPEQLRALAKRYNLPAEVLGVGPNPIVAAFAGVGADGEKTPSKAGQKQAPPPAAISTGLPKDAEDIGQQIDALKLGLATLRTTAPGPKTQRANPEALQNWQAEKGKLESQLKELTKQYNSAIPTGINQRATYR